jgi:lipid-binding SYLF domain-containing protein
MKTAVDAAVRGLYHPGLPLRKGSVMPALVSRLVCVVLLVVPAVAWGQSVAPAPQPIAAPLNSGEVEVQTVVGARQALDEFFGITIEAIPPAMLAGAEGVAIFPNMIKGGFILGVNFGKGVLHVRNADRTWSPPVMATMGGGSLGFQAGVQAADIILVFKTPRSLNGLLNGQKVTLGADASIAAGPVGVQANAGTDARLGAEIYSYARSRGLFLGVSLGGSDISIDNNANAALYGRFGVTPADVFQNRGLAIRPEVQALMNDLNARSQAVAANAAQPQPVMPAARLTSNPPPLAPIGAPASAASVIDPPLVPIVPR